MVNDNSNEKINDNHDTHYSLDVLIYIYIYVYK